MVSLEHTNLRRRIGLSIAAAVVVAALRVAMAGASARAQTMDASGTSPSSQSSCTRVNCVFVLDKGRFTAFDAPGPGPQYIVDINNPGEIAGAIREVVADEGFHGFLRDKRGRLTKIDVPGATEVVKINDRGQIVGSYSEVARS
jgi:hypothetical protein